MADSNFSVDIPNLAQIVAAFQAAPEISQPIFQQGIEKAIAFLQMFTKDSTPHKTGNLAETFDKSVGVLIGKWFPTASYRGDVEFGTGPHVIVPVNKKALFWPGAAYPVKIVNHPGTKANPYMERIRDAAQPSITQMFADQLTQITQQIANQANG